MTFSYTQISQYYAARGAIGFDISTAGERRSLGRVYASALF